jgi:hypothetical protein
MPPLTPESKATVPRDKNTPDVDLDAPREKLAPEEEAVSSDICNHWN